MSEHPFAQYVRILGKGKKGSRPLTEDEAYSAMSMILARETEPEQLGAFLMLMRIKEESSEELAGFVRAARDAIQNTSATRPEVHLDWPSYSGKRRQLPWFILSALLLSENGINVLMHATNGPKAEKMYTPNVLAQLGINACENLDEVDCALKQDHFAFIPLENLSPALKAILDLRSLLGLRSPVNTLLRLLNPLDAPYLIQGVFHPGYRDTHQGAAYHLKQTGLSVFKGEGGAAERNPDGECQVLGIQNGECFDETWPALFDGPRHLKDSALNPQRLIDVWAGKANDEYGEAAITGTAAIALKMIGRATDMDSAQTLADGLWANRARMRFSSQ